MGLSSNDRARGRQLANLQQGGGVPTEPGNGLARKHGAYAAIVAERLDAVVSEIFEALAADAPLRDQGGELPPADVMVVELLAESLCRRHDVRAWLGAQAAESDGPARPDTTLIDLERRLRREAATYADQLGMTPRSRARLGLDLVRSVDLSRAMSEPDPQKRREMMAAAGYPIADEETEGGES